MGACLASTCEPPASGARPGGRLAEQDRLDRRQMIRGRQSTDSVTPGRFFFIWIAVVYTSSAPGSHSRVVQ